MNRKELTKTFMMILNWKNPLVSMASTKKIQFSALRVMLLKIYGSYIYGRNECNLKTILLYINKPINFISEFLFVSNSLTSEISVPSKIFSE